MRTFVRGWTFLFLGLGTFLLWFYWNILYAITKLFFSSVHNTKIKVCHEVLEVFKTVFTFVLNLLLIFMEWDGFFFHLVFYPYWFYACPVLLVGFPTWDLYVTCGEFIFHNFSLVFPQPPSLSIFKYLVNFFISSIFFCSFGVYSCCYEFFKHIYNNSFKLFVV